MKNHDCKDDDATLLVLDGQNAKILAIGTDGLILGTILENCGGTPDGIAIDKANRHIYWTNMGDHYDQNDGSIERIDFEGSNRTVIIPKGETFTPKQLKLDLVNRHLYWCDREGMRVMRSSFDGTGILTLIMTGNSQADRQDETNHCVGVTLDAKRGHIYWTQKGPSKGGKGRIFRAGLISPEGETPESRSDIELLWENLPEPIDLDLNEDSGELYWTDRGAPPNGNSVNRANIATPFKEPEILTTGLDEAIGMALDIENDRVFFSDLGGDLYCRKLSGTTSCLLFRGDGRFTGIAYLDQRLIIKKIN